MSLIAAILFALFSAGWSSAEPLVIQGTLIVESNPGGDALRSDAKGARGMAAGTTRGGMGGGNRQTGPAPVQFFMPVQAESKLALVLVPGGGLSSWSYTATPDGREGWAQQFAAAGYPVYLLNPPGGISAEKGRWNKESVWPLWGIGPEYGKPYADARFPVDHIDTLESSFAITRSPGAAGHLSVLLDRIGPAVVLGHSAGGGPMFSVARDEHANLRGTIAVETINCPADSEQLKAIYVKGGRPFLSIWGDNLDRGSPSMRKRYQSCRQASETIAAAGGIAETVHLPIDKNIQGNSHLLMQDRNSTEIGMLILGWLQKNFK